MLASLTTAAADTQQYFLRLVRYVVQLTNTYSGISQSLLYAEQSLGRSEAPDSSEGLKGPDSGDRIAQALKTSFKDLDAQILAEEQQQGVEKGAFGGCTAVVALVMGDVSPPADVALLMGDESPPADAPSHHADHGLPLSLLRVIGSFHGTIDC